MEPTFTFNTFIAFIIAVAVIWYFGAQNAFGTGSTVVPEKPNSGYENLASACILYIQAMPVCSSAASANLPSYLSPDCKNFINKNVVKAPGCKF